MHYIVVAYDITDDARRLQVAKVLEDFGTRVQKSVFECLLGDRDLVRLQDRLRRIIDESTDSVRFYRQCRRCQKAIEVLGRGPSTLESEDILIV